ncbi:bidirectional hydrogenase complex protein HoxE [Oxynema aestuarii]|jgi:bidirectional [NiFe] hydrogenase diaphorase subunit|uniref:Bidirectional hydrogenase complex protein HoxE n=1 Tax=Oxynema aestuarii AP17 TaxID=2064643 RepID=A0A6H1TZJ4_9CYAN|nr:bidirectional hydrogenase complex protein HoxE [Oxynema aestuarii]QIZ71340.1 bidirectional hydrogenase complex protein HoxE [Oxynema aestuarii AP17]RMH71033.1 MAG: bidirectional hydrogenase complex protein HoxE [Cyanobacteria bacterium J007]
MPSAQVNNRDRAPSAGSKAGSKAGSNAHPSGDKRFKVLDITMKRNQHRQDALIEVLHKAQEIFGYLEEDVLLYVARQLKLPLSKVYGVATFYHLFSLKPSGAHTCVVCLGTACYVKGASSLLEALKNQVGIEPGETTDNGQMSVMTARCIGACGLAPAAVYDGKVMGNQTAESVLDNIKGWLD